MSDRSHQGCETLLQVNAASLGYPFHRHPLRLASVRAKSTGGLVAPSLPSCFSCEVSSFMESKRSFIYLHRCLTSRKSPSLRKGQEGEGVSSNENGRM